jgi:hypothetical protein
MLHCQGLLVLSLGVRVGLLPSLGAFAEHLLEASMWTLPFGTPHGGMQVVMQGRGPRGRTLTLTYVPASV